MSSCVDINLINKTVFLSLVKDTKSAGELGEIRFIDGRMQIYTGSTWALVEDDRQTERLIKPKHCECCGAPLIGYQCEYCGVVYE